MLASRSLEQLVDVLFESGFNGRELSALIFGVVSFTGRGSVGLETTELNRKATRIVLVGGQ